MNDPLIAIAALGVSSAILSWSLTFAMIRIAPRIGFVDKPGHRKIHFNPKPLGGGVAIFWAIALPLFGVLIYAHFMQAPTVQAGRQALINGIVVKTPLAMKMLLAMFAMHLLGLWDDKKALGPYLKLVLQISVTALLVIFSELRALTALGPVISILVTVLWIAGITNAFNFLDNMDGLSAGIAAVASVAFLVTALSIGQFFVAAMLVILLGALLGFLYFNFSPAKIFMGDSGSLLIGFLLGILTVRTTFLQHQPWGAGWYAIFAPVIVLAVPLYDLIVVSIIRLMDGKSPFVGDKNHFSHRLVRRGMSQRTAVLCLYLVTAATSVAAVILPQVNSPFAAILIFCQTLLILGVVALLEQHPLPPSDSNTQ